MTQVQTHNQSTLTQIPAQIPAPVLSQARVHRREGWQQLRKMYSAQDLQSPSTFRVARRPFVWLKETYPVGAVVPEGVSPIRLRQFYEMRLFDIVAPEYLKSQKPGQKPGQTGQTKLGQPSQSAQPSAKPVASANHSVSTKPVVATTPAGIPFVVHVPAAEEQPSKDKSTKKGT